LIEGMQAGGPVAMGGEGFTVRGSKPCPKNSGRGRVGTASGVVEEVDGVAGCSGVDENECLFGGRVAFVGYRVRLCGGGPGLFVILPGIANITEIERLPSGEGVHFREQRGEWFASTRSETVRGQPLHLPNFCLEFVSDDDGAELPIESANSVELPMQEFNGDRSTRRAASSN
jgi:hypothetical protein